MHKSVIYSKFKSLVILYSNWSNCILNQIRFCGSPFSCSICPFFTLWGTLFLLRIANVNLKWVFGGDLRLEPEIGKKGRATMIYLAVEINFGIEIFIKYEWCKRKWCSSCLSVCNDLKWVSVGFIRIWASFNDKLIIHIIFRLFAKIKFLQNCPYIISLVVRSNLLVR